MNKNTLKTFGIVIMIVSAVALVMQANNQNARNISTICKPAVVTAVRGYNLLPPEVHIAGACGDRLILSGSMAMTLAAQYNEGDTIR